MLRKGYKIAQIKIVPVMEQADPDGVKTPDEWRLNVYHDVVIDDDEDELFIPMITREVVTYTKDDPWDLSPIPEAVALCEVLFGDNALFVDTAVVHESRAVRGRVRPTPVPAPKPAPAPTPTPEP